MNVLHEAKVVLVTQREFALVLYKKANGVDLSTTIYPLELNDKLALDQGDFFYDPLLYRRLTRLGILSAVPKPGVTYSTLSGFATYAQYLKRNTFPGIGVSKEDDFSLRAYCDSDWEACPVTSCEWFLCFVGFQSFVLDVQDASHNLSSISLGKILIHEKGCHGYLVFYMS
ncbi:hypothetical protein V2J09_008566 [Rumex salicifolius]